MDITCYTLPYTPLHHYSWCSGLRLRACRILCRQNIYFCLIRRLSRQKYHFLAAIAESRDDDAWPISRLLQHRWLRYLWNYCYFWFHQRPFQQVLLRWVLQEASMRSAVNASPPILLSLLLRDCRSLLKLDGNFVFSSIRVVVSSFEISWNSSCGTLIRSLASWKYIKGTYVKEFSLAVDE